MPLLDILFVCVCVRVCVCVCVFVSYHLIDVNLEAPSENVTIPINVHQSD